MKRIYFVNANERIGKAIFRKIQASQVNVHEGEGRPLQRGSVPSPMWRRSEENGD